MGVSSFQGLQPRELNWWRIANFNIRSYGTSTHSASDFNRKGVEQRGARFRITHYCMEQIGFFQQNSQQISIPFRLLATQVKVNQLLVNNRLIRPQRCNQLRTLRGSFR